ncbi:MAG: aminotransferase class IV, partial [Planctomycetota bacterium]
LKSLQTAINRLVQLNNIEHGFVRMAVSSSEEPMRSMKFSSSDYSTTKESSNKGSYQTSMIFIETGHVSPEYEKYRRSGGSIIIYPYRRSSETPYYKHKTLAYMENLLARRWAFKRKAIEAIFINTNNYVMEGTRSTIFIVKDRKVFTPSIESNILRGVTRQAVIGLCTKNAIKVREKLLRKEDIFSSDEVFLTSSLMQIMPAINCKIKTENNTIEKIITDGFVGPITRVLQNSYEELLQISCK